MRSLFCLAVAVEAACPVQVLAVLVLVVVSVLVVLQLLQPVAVVLQPLVQPVVLRHRDADVILYAVEPLERTRYDIRIFERLFILLVYRIRMISRVLHETLNYTTLMCIN